MGFKRFSILISLRVVAMMLVLTGLIFIAMRGDFIAATLLVALLLCYQIFEVVHFVSKTNQELTRFLEAAKYADYSQRFTMRGMGAGFEELGSIFTQILKGFHTQRAQQEEDVKYLRAVVEHVPVPLISLKSTQQVTVLNNAARKFFAQQQVTQLPDLQVFGDEFVQQIIHIVPGERRLANIEAEGVSKQVTLSATQVSIGTQQQKLISLLDIQSELDVHQLKAWQDLVRVLTHEIMNSITPVASLAKTAQDLVSDVKQKVSQSDLIEELDDVESAVSTVARRSDGLMNFVSSFRQLTRLPAPNKQHTRVSELIHNALNVAQYDNLSGHRASSDIEIEVNVTPVTLSVALDVDMVEQVLINLLRNAKQALTQTTMPSIRIHATLNRAGRVVLMVEDNGPGIAKGVAEKIFVPFFTTKRDGSGVGLALTRQVMIAHGGQVKLDSQYQQGARFVLTF